MPSLLVTNDFPPKVGGIQSYLHELWRRLPGDETTVLTARYPAAEAFDTEQPFRVVRRRERVLFPTRAIARDADALAREVGADVVFVDPMLPLGLIGRRLRAAPHVVIAHGAEVTLPSRLPGSNVLARQVLGGARGIVAAGEYPARVAARAAGGALDGIVIPPGVDATRFVPLDGAARAEVRQRLGLDPVRPLVLGVSRLVPRKGFDTLIDAVAGLDDSVQLVIAGDGRDRRRLVARAGRRGIAARTRFLGRVTDAALPGLYAAADVFSMLCRDRWAGLEAEGFGIVFVEAAACGVPSIAGRSGGSHEAVDDGRTGFVVEPRDVRAVRASLQRILGDNDLRRQLGAAARERAANEFSYDKLAGTLAPVAAGRLDVLRPLTPA